MNAPALRTLYGDVEYLSFGSGPALLALHGAMGGWDQAALLARAVAPIDFQVIALSRPGYLGTALDTGRSPEEQADLYAATLDALHIERAAVLAISGGSPSAIQFALRYPERCSALVLISSVGERMRERLPLSFHLMMWLGRRTWFATRLKRRMERDSQERAQRAIRDPDLRARTLADPESGPLFREMLASTSDRIALRLRGTKQDVMSSRAARPELEDIRVPTLVVHGKDDRVVPFEQHGAVLARRIPNAELLAVEGGEHVAVFTHRALIKAHIDAFLRAHVGK